MFHGILKAYEAINKRKKRFLNIIQWDGGWWLNLYNCPFLLSWKEKLAVGELSGLGHWVVILLQ